ncbi:MAG: 3-oxoacyl-[acyl-carrier-protein] synthase III, partial [Bacteroidia bacterium]
MNFKNVAIESLAYALPDEVWTSADVEAKLAPVYERLHLPEGRLELMTGIKERRFFPAGSRASEASALAGEAVLAKSAFDRSEIDLLIHSAVCRDRLEPATAAYVHGLLGLPGKTQIFDVSNACLGFLNAMVIAASMIESGQIERALVVSGENGRPLVENTLQQLLNPELTRKSIKPYFANLTIGAGAVGALLCHKDLAPKSCPLVTAAVVETDSSANELCQGDSAGDALEMLTDSEELLVAGIGVATRAWARFVEATGWTPETPDRVITHQVGKAHSRELFKALGLDLTKDYTTFETLGNVGSVSCP